MSKNEFFNVLMDSLKDIPEKKLQDIILYYENLFDSEMSSGKSEDEIVSDLGNIDVLINKYKDNSGANESIKDMTESFFNSELYNSDNLKSKKNYIIQNETNENYNNADSSYSYTNSNATDNSSGSIPKSTTTIKKTININSILKVCILILSCMIFLPIFTSVLGIVIGVFGSAIGLLLGSIGVLIGGTFTSFAGIPNIPNFISNFPYPVLVLFCLGSITLSIMLFILFCYLTKALIIGIRKLYSLLMS